MVASLGGEVARWILSLPPWTALAVVFLLPALEASAFVGLVVPGETGVILGGVLASQGRISLPAALVAATLGAWIGDSVGYVVGRRWGHRLLSRFTGRVLRREHIEKSERYLRERGGRAVLLGRFTAGLRTLVPGLAGMSGVPYRSFLLWNVVGGAVWAGCFVLFGYAAGASWATVERYAGGAGLVLLVAVAFGLVAAHLAQRGRARAFQAWVARRRSVAWLRTHFPRATASLGRRLDLTRPQGFWLSLCTVLAVLGLWAFGAVAQQVLQGKGTARLDQGALRFALAHREGALAAAARAVAWLGSLPVVTAVAAARALVAWIRERDVRTGPRLAVALGGALLLAEVARIAFPRTAPAAPAGAPPPSSFPSVEAALAVSVYGGVAFTLAAKTTPRWKIVAWVVALALAVAVGAAQVVSADAWLTDVVGGWALGGAWLFALAALGLSREPLGGPPRAAPSPAAATRAGETEG